MEEIEAPIDPPDSWWGYEDDDHEDDYEEDDCEEGEEEDLGDER